MLVTQYCLTLCDPADCSPPGSSVHGNLQTRILEWVSHSFHQGIFMTQGSNPSLPHCRQILYHWAIREAPINFLHLNVKHLLPAFLTLLFTNTIFYDIIADLLDFLSSSLASSKLHFLSFPAFSEETYLINLGRVKFIILSISRISCALPRSWYSWCSLYWNLFACLSLHYTVNKSY